MRTKVGNKDKRLAAIFEMNQWCVRRRSRTSLALPSFSSVPFGHATVAAAVAVAAATGGLIN